MLNAPADAVALSLKSIVRSHIVDIRALCAVVALCFLTNCSSRPRIDYEPVNTSNIRVQAISPKEQAIEDISKMPTQFVQGYPAAQYAWDRAQIFFKNHTSQSRFSAGSGSEIRISNRASLQDPYIFEVSRKDGPTGAQFAVRCLPRSGNANDPMAELNCKNLARFVRDGTLETSLLVDSPTRN